MTAETVQVDILDRWNGDILDSVMVVKPKGRRWGREAKSEAMRVWRQSTGEYKRALDAMIVTVAE